MNSTPSASFRSRSSPPSTWREPVQAWRQRRTAIPPTEGSLVGRNENDNVRPASVVSGRISYLAPSGGIGDQVLINLCAGIGFD
jgi:hypothetical protein